MAWHDKVRTGIGRPVMAGLVTLAIGFGGFGAWAGLAPLEGAVIAPGKVIVEGQNKAVQHLEGGIVKQILVDEGQSVAAGDPVLVLDETSSRASANRLAVQLTTLEAVEARAIAERDGWDTLVFPESLVARGISPEVAKVLEDQQAEFQARLNMQRTEEAIFNQRIAALRESITGFETQRQETRNQIELIASETAALEILLEKKLTTRSRVSELKRTEADLKGREGQLTASIAQAKASITEAEEQIRRAKGMRIEEAAIKLSEARLKRAEIAEQFRAAQDVIDRVIVRAPASGSVMNLTKFNSGAVIAPGQQIMEIVPDGTGLLVEARIRPQDIDQVRVGQQANLSFTALDTRVTPPVPGEVVHVSADRLDDKRTGDIYYLVRLSISSAPLPGFDPAKVGPGQPVEVFITTVGRTFLSYVVEPITQTLRRGLRES